MSFASRHHLAASLILLVGLSSVVAQREADIVEPFQPMPSAALILSPGTQGSGVVIDRTERLLLTNHHVATAGQNVEAIFPIWADDGRVMIKRDLYVKKGQRIQGKCLASNPQRDLAILQLSALPATVGQVKLAAGTPSLNERVFMMGCPAKSTQVWVNCPGKVTALDKVPKISNAPLLNARFVELAALDRNIGPGASGGPTVNEKGELIGIIQSGKMDASQINCVDISEVRGFFSDFFRKQAAAATAKKEFPQAIERLMKAVEINPRDALAFHERAAAQSFQTRYKEAVADYSAAVKIDPKMSRSWRGRASAYYNLGEYTKAAADCTQAIAVDPQYALAYLSRSRAYDKLGKTSEAAADRATAQKLDPSLK